MLALNYFSCPNWPGTCDLSAFSIQVLGLHGIITMPSLTMLQILKNTLERVAGGMPQWLKTLPALAEDQLLILSTYVVSHNLL